MYFLGQTVTYNKEAYVYLGILLDSECKKKACKLISSQSKVIYVDVKETSHISSKNITLEFEEAYNVVLCPIKGWKFMGLSSNFFGVIQKGSLEKEDSEFLDKLTEYLFPTNIS